MRDGIVNKFAIIINGGEECRHQRNVGLSLDILESQGYETFVASSEQTDLYDCCFYEYGLPLASPDVTEEADHYFAPTRDKIQLYVREIQRRIDDDDELLIYITGHGSGEGFCLGEDCATQDLMSLMDISRYGQRVVVMAQSLSGNWSEIFLNDPHTIFISGASYGEIASSQFSPLFWSDNVPDLNEDGEISWQERYTSAVNRQLRSGTYAFPRFFSSDFSSVQEIEDDFAAQFAGNPDQTYEERISMLIGLLSSEEVYVRWGAIRSLDYIVGSGFNYQPLGSADALRLLQAVTELLHDEIDDIGAAALLAYKRIAERLDIGTMEQVAVFKSQFKSGNRWIRNEAVNNYLALVGQMEPAEAMAEAINLLKVVAEWHGNYYHYIPVPAFYQEVFKTLTERMGPDSAGTFLRNIFNDEDSRFVLRDSYCRSLLMPFCGDSIENLDSAKLADEAGLLRSYFNHEDDFVKQYAIIIYRRMAMTGELDSAELLEGMRALVPLFGSEDYETRQKALTSYVRLALILDSDGVAEGARTIRSLFNTEECEIREAAFRAYEELLHKIGPAEALEADRALRAYLTGAEWDFKAVELYEALTERLDSMGIAERGRVLRELLAEGNITKNRYLAEFYAEIADQLEPSEIQAGAAVLRSLFGHADSREITSAYEKLIPYLNSAEIAEAVRTLRSLFTDEDRAAEFKYNTVHFYQELVEKIDNDALLVEERELRELLTDENVYEYDDTFRRNTISAIYDNSFKAYLAVAARLSPAVALEAAREFREVFEDESSYDSWSYWYSNWRYHDFADKSATLYGVLAERLDPSAAAEEARAVRSLFEHESSLVDRNAAFAYHALAPKLDSAELAEGVRVLNQVTSRYDRHDWGHERIISIVEELNEQLRERSSNQ